MFKITELILSFLWEEGFQGSENVDCDLVCDAFYIL